MTISAATISGQLRLAGGGHPAAVTPDDILAEWHASISDLAAPHLNKAAAALHAGDRMRAAELLELAAHGHADPGTGERLCRMAISLARDAWRHEPRGPHGEWVRSIDQQPHGEWGHFSAISPEPVTRPGAGKWDPEASARRLEEARRRAAPAHAAAIQRDSLPDDESAAVMRYAAVGADISAALRDGRDHPDIPLLDRAMSHGQLKSGITTYRAVRDPARIFGPGWENRDLTGKTWTDRGFASTSASGSVTTRSLFGGVPSMRPGAGVYMRVHVQPGVSAVSVSPESGNESEILLNRGLTYTVTRDHGYAADGLRELDVTASAGVPGGGPPPGHRVTAGPLDYTPLLDRDYPYDQISTGGGQDQALKAIARLQGFDGPPDIVSDAELDRRAAGGERELWRGFNGINGGGRNQTRGFASQFLHGPYFAGAGHMGNGTYVSTDDTSKLIADVERDYQDAPRNPDGTFTESWVRNMYARDMKRARNMARNRAAGYATSHGTLVRMTLDRGARVITWDQLQAEWAQRYLTLRRAADTGNQRAGRELALLNDPGRFAAIEGYDAIDMGASGPGELLILNRTAVHASSRLQDAGTEGNSLL